MDPDNPFESSRRSHTRVRLSGTFGTGARIARPGLALEGQRLRGNRRDSSARYTMRRRSSG